MGAHFYRTCRSVGRFIQWQTMRQVVLNAETADRAGGFVLACSHLSHLEPFIVSGAIERHVRWMARIEFYQRRWQSFALNHGGAFPIDRFGRSLPAVRTAVRLALAGECVGIFPEGGVTRGCESVLRGAPIKQGVCTIAVQTRLPVIPVVVLGTDRLNSVKPWLPLRRTRLWIAFGNDVLPPPRSDSRRADRAEMALRLRKEYVHTYQHLLSASRGEITDAMVP
ncbi:MAG: lysophospholipid acyltransferase family protein [Phycisphaerales bacterium]|nr:lysophospholipid acyltransferase family protein [Phycisphaerales bacterium]